MPVHIEHFMIKLSSVKIGPVLKLVPAAESVQIGRQITYWDAAATEISSGTLLYLILWIAWYSVIPWCSL